MIMIPVVFFGEYLMIPTHSHFKIANMCCVSNDKNQTSATQVYFTLSDDYLKAAALMWSKEALGDGGALAVAYYCILL